MRVNNPNNDQRSRCRLAFCFPRFPRFPRPMTRTPDKWSNSERWWSSHQRPQRSARISTSARRMLNIFSSSTFSKLNEKNAVLLHLILSLSLFANLRWSWTLNGGFSWFWFSCLGSDRTIFAGKVHNLELPVARTRSIGGHALSIAVVAGVYWSPKVPQLRRW